MVDPLHNPPEDGSVAEGAPRLRFDLTPRQRRLRVLTVVILCAIIAMFVFAMIHPFFHLPHPSVLTPRLRKALAVQGLLILCYWTVCFLLTCSLFLVAWLDIREVRLKLATARRDMWRDIAERSRGRRGAAPPDGPA